MIKKKNTYVRELYMQGGKPKEIEQEFYALFEDGTATINGFDIGITWKVYGCYLEFYNGKELLTRYTKYSASISNDSCFYEYGSRLVPTADSEFVINVVPVIDNIKEPMNEHLFQLYPECKRYSTRVSKDFFDLLPKGGKYLEVGVAYANYSKLLWDNCNPSEIHLVDCWEEVKGAGSRSPIRRLRRRDRFPPG